MAKPSPLSLKIFNLANTDTPKEPDDLGDAGWQMELDAYLIFNPMLNTQPDAKDLMRADDLIAKSNPHGEVVLMANKITKVDKAVRRCRVFLQKNRPDLAKVFYDKFQKLR